MEELRENREEDMDLTNNLLDMAAATNKVMAMPLTYCDEISCDILTLFQKTSKYKPGKARYDINGTVQFAELHGRGYRIDVRPLPIDHCSNCGRKMQPVGYKGELLCVSKDGFRGCDDPVKEEK